MILGVYIGMILKNKDKNFIYILIFIVSFLLMMTYIYFMYNSSHIDNWGAILQKIAENNALIYASGIVIYVFLNFVLYGIIVFLRGGTMEKEE